MNRRTVVVVNIVALVFFSIASAQERPTRSIRDLFTDEYDIMLYNTEKNALSGHSVALGDVNGDGLDDLIVGAPLGTGNEAGITYVYFGRSSPEDTVNLAEQADLAITGVSGGDHSGHAVAAGDLNADGVDDVIIGAPVGGPSGSQFAVLGGDPSGTTYVVFGRRSAPESATIDLGSGAADAELYATNGGFSGSALAVGDFNGDGVDDLAIGAPFADDPINDGGNTFVVCGSPSLTGRVDLASGSCAIVQGVGRGDRSGMGLAMGDVNGDGIDDLAVGGIETDGSHALIGPRNAGLVSVVLGRTEGPPVISLETDAVFSFSGDDTNDYVGSAIAIGDVDADGFDDLLIGASHADVELPGEDKLENAGKAFLFYGGETLAGLNRLEEHADAVFWGPSGGWGKGSTFYGAFTGAAVVISDLDDDGRGDLVIAAPLADSRGRMRRNIDDMRNVGSVLVVHGHDRLSGGAELGDVYNQGFFGAYARDYFGGVIGEEAWRSFRYDRVVSASVATGDLNGDGLIDLAIGAPAGDGARSLGDKKDDAGVVYVFLSQR